jgi:hypothetical protein
MLGKIFNNLVIKGIYIHVLYTRMHLPRGSDMNNPN